MRDRGSGRSGKAAHLPAAIDIIGAAYLTLQICMAILNAVAGLERRGSSNYDYLPANNEAEADYLRTRMRQIRGLIVSCRNHANDKVTRMAAAQRAAQNFLGALASIPTAADQLTARARSG